jgi:hypothetical protein
MIMGRIPCRHNDNGSRKRHMPRGKGNMKMNLNRDQPESNAV